jgi:hypothetical protein
MNDITWSESEKKVARRAFDAALHRECAAIMERLKDLAAKAESPKDIWAIQEYLTEQRRAIDEKYDYRYSQLIFVFGRLLGEKWLKEEDIAGLREEKIRSIRSIVSL